MRRRLENIRLPSVDLGFLALAAVLTASLVLNVRLGLEARAPAPVFVESGFQVGMRLPDITAAPLGGAERPLTFGRTTLVYIFSPRCEWTRSDYPNLKAIVDSAGKNYDVLGLYLRPRIGDDEVLQYLDTHPFTGKVAAVDMNKTTLPENLVRRFSTTPQLLVVVPGGLIRRAWSGALFDRRKAEAEGYFGLTLPGALMVGGMAAPYSVGASTR